jgi:hypothetical protein
MSASFYYQPVTGTHLPVGAPRAFLQALRRALGRDGPWELSGEDVHRLEDLAAAVDAEDQQHAVRTLLEAVARSGTIRLWLEY